MAYMNSGNFGTAIQAGSTFGHALVIIALNVYLVIINV
jgi:Mn2+/Fe2+ NRAMP family transporter